MYLCTYLEPKRHFFSTVFSENISQIITLTPDSRPIQDIDLPELPDFLKPEASSTSRPLNPIQDIDLPEGFEVVMEGDHQLTQEEISKQEETSGEN
jgi:hypothetical protein